MKRELGVPNVTKLQGMIITVDERANFGDDPGEFLAARVQR